MKTLTKNQEKSLEEYLSDHCTGRCGKDVDCPHIEEWCIANDVSYTDLQLI